MAQQHGTDAPFSIAAPGLRDVGLTIDQPIADAELQLYALLSARDTRATCDR